MGDSNELLHKARIAIFKYHLSGDSCICSATGDKLPLNIQCIAFKEIEKGW